MMFMRGGTRLRAGSLAVATGAAALALFVAGCGDDDEGDSASSSSGDAKAGKVAVLLPDSKSSVRWESVDRPFLKAAFEKAGVDAEIQNAEGDKSTQQQQAEQAITNGAKVLLLVNLDSGSGAAIAANAKSQGVKVIDYDRLTLDTDATDYYVSFNNEKVGQLQGQGIVDCLGDKQGAEIAVLNGSPTDNNATLFREGYQAAIADSGIETVGEEAVPDWDNAQAAVIFEQLLTAAGGDIDGVLVANDGLSLAAQQVLADAGLTLPTTGQDATPEGLRAILEGTQCMTVYKPVAEEANAAVAAAAALLNGEEIDTSVTIDNEVAEIPYVQAEIQSIFISDVHIPVDDGFVAYADVCNGIEDLCTENGIVDPGGEAMVETTVTEAMVETTVTEAMVETTVAEAMVETTVAG